MQLYYIKTCTVGDLKYPSIVFIQKHPYLFNTICNIPEKFYLRFCSYISGRSFVKYESNIIRICSRYISYIKRIVHSANFNSDHFFKLFQKQIQQKPSPDQEMT